MYGAYGNIDQRFLYFLCHSKSTVNNISCLSNIIPFKCKLIHIFNSGLMIKLIFIYLTSWIFNHKWNSLMMKIICFSSVFLTFVTLVMLIIYHVLWVYRKPNIVKMQMLLNFIHESVMIIYLEEHTTYRYQRNLCQWIILRFTF